MKDNFSSKSNLYAKFRPTYPSAFYEYLNKLVNLKLTAWDCGTGTGQVAVELAKTFSQVYASDLSQAQIAQAPQKSNINYRVQRAEKTSYAKAQFDLITVAQAIHWFDFNQFYDEVGRTLKPSGLLCIMGYGNLQISEEIDAPIRNFYKNVLGGFWDVERTYINEEYRCIPFPFKEIPTPDFTIRFQWTLEHLIGYLNTWSAVKHYLRKRKENPVTELHQELLKLWNKEEIKEIRFPMLLRIGSLA